MIRSPFRALQLLAGVCAVTVLFLSSSAYGSTQSDSARQKAKEILSDKKYAGSENAPLSDHAQKLSRWLGEKKRNGTIKERSDSQIKSQSNPRTQRNLNAPTLPGLGAVGTILLWTLVILITIGLGYLLYKIIANIKAKPASKKQDEAVSEEFADIDWSQEDKVLEFITDADQLDLLSRQAEEAGNFDLALRYRFRSGLLRLDNLQMITFNPSTTNVFYQLQLNNESFDELTKDFNDVTYGKKDCGPTQLSRARQIWSVLVSNSGGQSK